MSKSNSGNDHRASRNSKDSHRDSSHRDEKSSSQRSTTNNGAAAAAAAATTTTDRAFKDKHHPLLIAIWNTDRTQTNVDEKLKGLRDLIRKGTNPSVNCEILHEQTGTPIAQVSPLIIACFEGDIDIIRFFIENGADPNQTESEHHLTPIHVLCDAEYHGQSLRQKDRADLIRMLVKHGAQVNHLDRSSMAPIHKAVIHDRPECVEVLMESRADPNVAFMGDTPLSIAARHNRKRIVQILLSHKETNVNHRNDQGGSALHFASAAIVDSPECVEILLQHGAKVNAQDLKNNTAAMVACFFNKPRILTTLIRAGADLVPRNNEGKDAYDVAVEKEFDECKDIVAKALEKRGIKAGVKPTPTVSTGDKLSDDLEKLKVKR
jgi:ankyrin repeat protein